MVTGLEQQGEGQEEHRQTYGERQRNTPNHQMVDTADNDTRYLQYKAAQQYDRSGHEEDEYQRPGDEEKAGEEK